MTIILIVWYCSVDSILKLNFLQSIVLWHLLLPLLKYEQTLENGPTDICVKQPVRVLARLVDTCRSQTWPRIIVKAGMEAMLTSYLAKQLHHYKPQTISGVCDWKCKRIFWITISINWNYFQVFVRGNGHPDPHPGYWKPQKVAVGPGHPPG